MHAENRAAKTRPRLFRRRPRRPLPPPKFLPESERKARPEVVEAHAAENESARVASEALESIEKMDAERVLDEATRGHEKRAAMENAAAEFGQHSYWKKAIDLSVSADELAA